LLLFALTVFFTIIVVRNAWITDDAYITFRTVDNFINGYGLRWNIANRVQAYTNPLWMFLVSLIYYVTREIYFSVLLLSIIISLATVWLFVSHLTVNAINGILGVAVFSFSQAFISYSTSGLENPLTHFILTVFLILYYRLSLTPGRQDKLKNIFFLMLCCSLGTLNRMDTFLLFAPPITYIIIKNRKNSWLVVLLGLAPFIVWELFSLLYYGFPFPNTAYAKLNTCIPQFELTKQGFYYFINSLNWDPITLFIITSATLYSLVLFSKNPRNFFVAVGISLYLIYIVGIGGDFMSGRFFTAPLLCSVVLLGRAQLRSLPYGLCLLSILLILGLSSSRSPVKIDEHFHGKGISENGISDEHGYYYPFCGLLTANRDRNMPTYAHVKDGEKARRRGPRTVVKEATGMFAFYAGPDVHIIDLFGLGDPLLARLPVKSPTDWRIGHFYRTLPVGYLSSVTGNNFISDPSLAKYWNKIYTVTSGKLFTWKRFKEIFNFNTGRNDYLIDEYCAREYHVFKPYKLSTVKPEGTSWNAPGVVVLNRHGIGIKIDRHDIVDNTFSVSLNGGDKYVIAYYKKTKEIARQQLDVSQAPSGRLVHWQGMICPEALDNSFNLIRIFPVSGSGKYSIGHFSLKNFSIVKNLSEINKAKIEGTPWNEPGNIVFKKKGLLIQLGKYVYTEAIEISADNNDTYQIIYLRDGLNIGTSVVPKKKIDYGLSTRTIDVPGEVARQGYNILCVTPLDGDGIYSIGHVRLKN